MQAADIIVLCGDLTDLGATGEAELLAREFMYIKKPIVGVLGNHDFHGGDTENLKRIFQHAGVQILDGTAVEIAGVGFAGVKGFAGGFGQRMLAPWGESIIKQFVHEAIEESLKLETALATSAEIKVALLHYSPIFATVEGEPAEILPFLGSSRLEEPINRFKVAVAFHGHAHHGSCTGICQALAFRSSTYRCRCCKEHIQIAHRF